MPAPDLRCVIRWYDAKGQQHVEQRLFNVEGDRKLALELPDGCPWPPKRVRQCVVEFSPPVRR